VRLAAPNIANLQTQNHKECRFVKTKPHFVFQVMNNAYSYIALL